MSMLNELSTRSGGQAFRDLDERSREIFRQIVDAYVQSGEPVGSRTLSRRLGMSLSPATIRNVMADLEDAGLLFAPHTSAGRMPTDAGLRLFVHGLMQLGDVGESERASIDAMCAQAGRGVSEMLEEATSALSGLSACAGLVLAPKTDRPLKHIEFVNLSPGRALVVLVTEDGMVENRVLEVPLGLPASTFVHVTNYLNARIVGRTIGETRTEVLGEIESQKSQLDSLAAKVVAAGLATWSGGGGGTLIVKGQSRLLNDVTALDDLERIRGLFQALETKEAMLRMLDAANAAEGVQIFIGAENGLFSHTGCSMIIAPYKGGDQRVVGAVGVIGPTRLNYARIIPMVDYTAKMIGRLLRTNETTNQVA
ncbi:heat-inducible transcriptional repressor HrcA [Mycobacterium sp. KBS0706]|uniref:heat-inducible transcriptional repressor HrcA n=1 Tax=Mycobacterium sp. KBS0706 TaxID=2578109 RepID=UPI001C8F7424|nr:heat-inducible transcriptional repressor HrcA [Mycobacterium sp. KBS0706]